MVFKKKKIGTKKWFVTLGDLKNRFSSQQKGKNIIPISIGIISAFFIFVVGYGFFSQVTNLDFSVNQVLTLTTGHSMQPKNQKPISTLKKATDGKTNILIVGRWGEENDAPNLTDSIMVASVNSQSKMVSLFSIPRDLFIAYPTGWAWKINETYARGLSHFKDETQWMDQLKKVVQKITGQEIQYTINLDFQAFRKVIDALWGIQIDVPESIVDTTYPGPNHSYQTFRINAWLQTLDGETALKYARSRHSTSDYDRSLRQQLIIKWMREKVLSLEMLTSPAKIKSIYDIIQEHIKTDLSFSELLELAIFGKEIPKDNIVSSNLNDTCFYGSAVCEKWGFLYVPLRADFWWMSVTLPIGATKSTLSNYSKLGKYTNIVFNTPEVYQENQLINIFNATKTPWLAGEVGDNLKKYWFNIPSHNSIGNVKDEVFEKTKIYYSVPNTQDGKPWKKPRTVEALENFFLAGSENVPLLPKYSQDPEVKIEIVIGNDYKSFDF